MSKWLESGLRRDVCVVVAGEGDPTQQAVKRAVERKNDDRIKPRRFSGAVEKLESAGILAREQDGLHDRLTLTDAGEERLREHREWEAGVLGDWAENAE
jgi:DNA-binding PadR family transcriptional regulator